MKRARAWRRWFPVVLTAAACVAAPAPPRPAPPPPAPPPRAPIPPKAPAWAPDVDLGAKAELGQLDDCAEEHIDGFNDLAEEDIQTDGAPLLLAALECLEPAGHSIRSIRVLKYLAERYPQVAEANDARYRMRQHYRTLAHERLGARDLVGRACGASPFDPPPHASAEALVEIAECLEEQDMIGVPLRYRRLAAERGAGGDNAERIEVLTAHVEAVERAILDL